MKKLFLVLILIFVASISFAQSVGTPIKIQKPDGSWTYAKADNDGNLVISGITSGGGGVGTFTLVMPDPVIMDSKYGYVAGVQYEGVTNLATNSVTFLSSIASFVPPCEIEFSFQTDTFTGPATTTVSSAKVLKRLSDSSYSIKLATTSWNIGLVANTATGPVGIKIHTLGR